MIDALSEQLLDQIADRVSEKLMAGKMQTSQQHNSDLQSRYEEFTREHEFKPGQLVRWKAGLKNRVAPNYNESGIVVGVLAEPIYDSNTDAGNPYFREPLNILIALLDADGDLLVFHFDKRRFEPA